MKMYNVKEIKVLMNELCLNDMEEQILDFSNGYVGDVLSEIAGNNVSIYTSDLMDYLSNNIDYVNDHIDDVNDNISNMGFSGNILSHISDVWYDNNLEELYGNINDIVKYFTLDNIIDYMIGYNIKNISEEDLDNMINENCSDNIDRIDTIVDNIECYFEEYILN